MMQYLAIISPWANLRNKKQHYICDNEKDFQATFIDNIGNSKSKKKENALLYTYLVATVSCFRNLKAC